METSIQNDVTDENENNYLFIDAFDDFPFHDGTVTTDDQSTSDSNLVDPSPPEISSPSTTTTTLRRRRGISDADSSSTSSNIPQVHRDFKTRPEVKRPKLDSDLQGTESTRDDSDRVDSVSVVEDEEKNQKEVDKEESTLTIASDDDPVDDSVDSQGQLGDSSSASNLLVLVVGLVIKAVGFQLNLFVNLITFPIWVLYGSYMFVLDPFGAIRHVRGILITKLVALLNFIGGFVGSRVNDWLKDHKTLWKFLLRCGWGLFWSCYVCIILCGLFVFSVVISGVLMRYLVEEPMQIKENLNFDYTKNSPVAFVPIMSCGGVGCGVNCEEKIGDVKNLGSRVIPPNHKLQVTVLLTLPESEYNRKLGMFQVRVDFLSPGGKTLSSKSHPCMLKFKSEPIHVLLTFLKIAPLVAGYISESQTMELKIRGFTEGDVPTSCLKVMIEQRAEFRPGAGIPEIYDASLILESELPLFKRIIWSWKKTMFVWISMTSFMMQLLVTLICCRPLIIPRPRPRDGSAVNNSTPNNLPEQS